MTLKRFFSVKLLKDGWDVVDGRGLGNEAVHFLFLPYTHSVTNSNPLKPNTSAIISGKTLNIPSSSILLFG